MKSLKAIEKRHLRTNRGPLFDLYRYFYENERTVQSFLTKSNLKTIFKPTFLNGYDMAATLMPALGYGEDPLWRDVFAYNRAADMTKVLERTANWREKDANRRKK